MQRAPQHEHLNRFELAGVIRFGRQYSHTGCDFIRRRINEKNPTHFSAVGPPLDGLDES